MHSDPPYYSFDGWEFYAGLDINYGNVVYLSEQDAMSQQLAYVNSAGNVVLKVDNVTVGPVDDNFGRNSINITTTGTFYIGSLVIMDAVHMPFGVGSSITQPYSVRRLTVYIVFSLKPVLSVACILVQRAELA